MGTNFIPREYLINRRRSTSTKLSVQDKFLRDEFSTVRIVTGRSITEEVSPNKMSSIKTQSTYIIAGVVQLSCQKDNLTHIVAECVSDDIYFNFGSGHPTSGRPLINNFTKKSYFMRIVPRRTRVSCGPVAAGPGQAVLLGSRMPIFHLPMY